MNLISWSRDSSFLSDQSLQFKNLVTRNLEEAGEGETNNHKLVRVDGSQLKQIIKRHFYTELENPLL